MKGTTHENAIKPSLQNFQFYRFWRSLGILFSSILEIVKNVL
jgi:hypothetical protein